MPKLSGRYTYRNRKQQDFVLRPVLATAVTSAPEVLGDLDRVDPDPTGRTEDQRAPARLDLRHLTQKRDGGDAPEGKRNRFGVRQSLRLGDHGARGGHHDDLRVHPLRTGSEDVVARLELRDIGSDREDAARELATGQGQ